MPSNYSSFFSLSIFLYSIFYNLSLFFLTEIWFVMPNLPTWLFIIIYLASLLSTLLLHTKFKLRKYLPVVVIAAALAVVSNHFLNKGYQELQQTPRLNTVSKNWSIQGDKIVIRGKNFGQRNSESSLQVGSTRFLIEYWDNYQIKAKQPLPTTFETSQLVLCKDQESCYTLLDNFTIKDPAELL